MNNEISIAPISPGVLEITPASGTHLQFGAVEFTSGFDLAGYAKDSKVSLGGGNDSVTLGAGLYVHDVTPIASVNSPVAPSLIRIRHSSFVIGHSNLPP